MGHKAIASIALLLLLCALGILRAQKKDRPPVQDFDFEGLGVWQCQCTAFACPCQKNGAPVDGTCYAADVAHIKKGHYGKTKLDGLTVAMVGNIVDEKSDRLFATLYLDQQASPEQREALSQMVQFLNDSYVAVPGGPSVPIRKVFFVKLDFSESADKTTYGVTIPGILEEKTKLQRDSRGNPVSSIIAMDMWSNIVHKAENVVFRYHDTEVGKQWDQSGRYANVKFFHLTKKMYDDRAMLGQYGDMSGNWTPEQKDLIRKQRLQRK